MSTISNSPISTISQPDISPESQNNPAPAFSVNEARNNCVSKIPSSIIISKNTTTVDLQKTHPVTLEMIKDSIQDCMKDFMQGEHALEMKHTITVSTIENFTPIQREIYGVNEAMHSFHKAHAIHLNKINDFFKNFVDLLSQIQNQISRRDKLAELLARVNNSSINSLIRSQENLDKDMNSLEKKFIFLKEEIIGATNLYASSIEDVRHRVVEMSVFEEESNMFGVNQIEHQYHNIYKFLKLIERVIYRTKIDLETAQKLINDAATHSPIVNSNEIHGKKEEYLSLIREMSAHIWARYQKNPILSSWFAKNPDLAPNEEMFDLIHLLGLKEFNLPNAANNISKESHAADLKHLDAALKYLDIINQKNQEEILRQSAFHQEKISKTNH